MSDLQNKGDRVFSVIMPCYNSEAYLRGAVSSILAQTYPHWELIAVNDGSRDKTQEILQEYAACDRRIKLYSKENGGYISAVNLGLEKITGEYFLLMGSDDALAPTLFSQLNACAEAREPDCIAWRTLQMQNGRQLGPDSTTDFDQEVYMPRTTFASYIQHFPRQAAILSARDTSKCYKRQLLGDLRYFGKYGYDADGIFSMLLCHRASSFAAIPVDGYLWTLREDSLSGRKTFLAQELDRIENWVRFFTLLQQDISQITSTEKAYLHYFKDVVRRAWQDPQCTVRHYPLIRRAVQVIRRTASSASYDLSLSGEDRLLLFLPLLWKGFMGLPEGLRTLPRRVKNKLCQ